VVALRTFAAASVIVLVGCSSPPAALPSNAPERRPDLPSAPRAAASPSRAQGAEELIRAYQKLAPDGASPSELERFVAEHPALLEAEAEPYGKALLWVLQFGDEAAALALIRAGAPVAADEPGAALQLAARSGLDAVVAELIARGASPRSAGYWGTPLHSAAKGGHASTLRLLIGAGADPNVHASDHEFTPLQAAVIGRHVEAVRVLIAARADLEARDDDGRTALHWGGFAYAPQAVHVYSDLRRPHATRFVDPGPAEAVALLLDAGARIDAVDSAGNTPLHAAAQVGSRRVVELLLARGARRDVKNRAGQTSGAIARARNDPAIARLLGP
jgi:uncharacterized protein